MLVRQVAGACYLHHKRNGKETVGEKELGT